AECCFARSAGDSRNDDSAVGVTGRGGSSGRRRKDGVVVRLPPCASPCTPCRRVGGCADLYRCWSWTNLRLTHGQFGNACELRGFQRFCAGRATGGRPGGLRSCRRAAPGILRGAAVGQRHSGTATARRTSPTSSW